MGKISFPAILRWVEFAKEWRIVNIEGNDTQEFKTYDGLHGDKLLNCNTMQKIIDEVGLDKSKDNPVKITIEIKDGKWLSGIKSFKRSLEG